MRKENLPLFKMKGYEDLKMHENCYNYRKNWAKD